jgi:hypothetical protein
MAAPIREAFVAFAPVTITGGGNQSRGENGYWHVSTMVLLPELAARLHPVTFTGGGNQSRGRQRLLECLEDGAALGARRAPRAGCASSTRRWVGS